jgi:hypothetical protein
MRDLARGDGAMIISKGIVDRINELPLQGVALPVTRAEQILEALEAACEEKKCITCRRRPRSMNCFHCDRLKLERGRAANTAPAPSPEVMTSAATAAASPKSPAGGS